MHTVLKLFLPFTSEGNNVLQKDGFFRKRDEQRDNSLFRPSQPATPATVPAAYVAASPLATEQGEERNEAKLVAGPARKKKDAARYHCDTPVVEGPIDAAAAPAGPELADSRDRQRTVAPQIILIHGLIPPRTSPCHAVGCINRERELLEFQRGGLDRLTIGEDTVGLSSAEFELRRG